MYYWPIGGEIKCDVWGWLGPGFGNNKDVLPSLTRLIPPRDIGGYVPSSE